MCWKNILNFPQMCIGERQVTSLICPLKFRTARWHLVSQKDLFTRKNCSCHLSHRLIVSSRTYLQLTITFLNSDEKCSCSTVLGYHGSRSSESNGYFSLPWLRQQPSNDTFIISPNHSHILDQPSFCDFQLFRLNTAGQLGVGERCVNADSQGVKLVVCRLGSVDGPWEYDEVNKIWLLKLRR